MTSLVKNVSASVHVMSLGWLEISRPLSSRASAVTRSVEADLSVSSSCFLASIHSVSGSSCKSTSHRAREGIARDCILITALKREPLNTLCSTPRLSEAYEKRHMIDQYRQDSDRRGWWKLRGMTGLQYFCMLAWGHYQGYKSFGASGPADAYSSVCTDFHALTWMDLYACMHAWCRSIKQFNYMINIFGPEDVVLCYWSELHRKWDWSIWGCSVPGGYRNYKRAHTILLNLQNNTEHS